MTATEIQNVGAGIAALFVVFYTYLTFIKSLKPMIEKLDEVVRNNTQAITANKDASDNVAKALTLLELSLKNQTEVMSAKFDTHDARAFTIHEDVKEIKSITRDIHTKINIRGD